MRKWKAEQHAFALEERRRIVLDATQTLGMRLMRAVMARWQMSGAQKAWSQWKMHTVAVKHSSALSKSRQVQLEGDLAEMAARVTSLSDRLQLAQQDKAMHRNLTFVNILRRAETRGYRMAMRSWLSFCSEIDIARYVVVFLNSCLYIL